MLAVKEKAGFAPTSAVLELEIGGNVNAAVELDSVVVFTTAPPLKEKLGVVVLVLGAPMDPAIKGLTTAGLVVVTSVKANGFPDGPVVLVVATFPVAALAPNIPVKAGFELVSLLDVVEAPNTPATSGLLFG